MNILFYAACLFAITGAFSESKSPNGSAVRPGISVGLSAENSSIIQPSETPLSANVPVDEDSPSPLVGEPVDDQNRLPFALKTPTAKEAARVKNEFLKAVTAIERDPAKAIRHLRALNPTERLAQVYRCELLSRAFMAASQPQAADSVLRGALLWIGGKTWRNHFVEMRLQGFQRFDAPILLRKEFYAQILDSDAPRAAKADCLYDWLKLDGYAGDVKPHLEQLSRLLEVARSERRLDSLYRLAADKQPRGSRSWDEEWLLLGLELRLGLNDAALKRCEAMLPLVPGKSEKQRLHWQYAQVYWAKQDWSKAFNMYEKYLERYGDNPNTYLQLARAKDKMGQTPRAQIWYDKFLNLYPKHSKASEIHWIRAWDYEMDGRYREASELYAIQTARFPETRRGEWADFRIGLCHWKDSNFAPAAESFASYRRGLENKSSKSPIVLSKAAPAAQYWQAKALERLGQTQLADSLRLDLTLKQPFNYYGHLAREILITKAALPDSLQPWMRFGSSRTERIKAWMEEALPGYNENFDRSYESAYLSLSTLLSLRLDTLAILTQRSMPLKLAQNPWYLFLQSRRFEQQDLHPEAYKLALALAQIIPAERYATAPRELLRMIWPRPYEGEVIRYALKRNLDPALLFAIMRQESGFDREIRSRAGAVGLMQIMPATAISQAKGDSLKDFHPEDLNQAITNIRLGTFYVKSLMHSYGDDPYYMLANYNAGPEPTRRWQRTLGFKPRDEMVEDISYWETRDYVKKVMGNYWTYRLLYNNRLKGWKANDAARSR